MDKLAEVVLERHQTEQVVAKLVDTFLDGLNSAKPFSEADIMDGLSEAGVKAKHLKAVDPSEGEKTAALGGWISKGLWWLLVRPFKVLKEFIRSSKFRAEIIKAFTHELTSGHNVRATKHMVHTLVLWMNGQEVRPEELKSSLKHLGKLIAGLVVACLVANPVSGVLSTGVWGVLAKIVPSVANILLMILSKPLSVATNKLLTHFPKN